MRPLSRCYLLILLFNLVLCFNLVSANEGESCKVSLQAPTEDLVLVTFKIPKGKHIYWRNDGGVGRPTEIDWQLPPGITLGKAYWPPPRREEIFSSLSLVYDERYSVCQEIKIDPALSKPEVIKAKVTWLECGESTCIPGEAEVSVKVRKGENNSQLRDEILHRNLADREELNLDTRLEGDKLVVYLPDGVYDKADFFPYSGDLLNWQFAKDTLTLSCELNEGEGRPAKLSGLLVTGDKVWEVSLNLRSDEPSPAYMSLVWAFLGGIILNFMPCVFPVLSLKVLSLASVGQDVHRSRLQSLWFSLGICATFWLLALVMFGVRSLGYELGWGFQMQYPPFVAFMTLLFWLIALNLWGVFEVGLSLTRLEGQGAFSGGVLTVIASAPCTAPFMGVALGVALSSSLWMALAIFTCLGVGMALPYFVLANWPQFLQKLPKPGRWMEDLKSLLAFPLGLTCIYFIDVFYKEAGSEAALLLMVGLWLISLAVWIYGRFFHSKSIWPKVIFAILLVLGLFVFGLSFKNDTKMAEAEENRWSPQKVEEALQRGQIVFVDFGASWCLTCQFNERTVLQSERVQRLFAEYNVLFLKADWTNKDEEITRALQSFGRNGVPLYVVYTPEVKVLPELLTVKDIVEAVQGE
ncbi:thioredoxin family protein [bacterium]|nr:thioredoxin family protein [bacterium]